MSVAVAKTSLPGVLLCRRPVFVDPRGLFEEVFRAADLPGAGIPDTFVQDNHSRSSRDTVRGLHYQIRHPQAKLVSVLVGAIFDVVVDVRRGSPTFGEYFGLELRAGEGCHLYVPAGLAHGFAVLTDSTDVIYKCSEYYDAEGERGVRWDDPALAIPWPVESPILSEKDSTHPLLAQIAPEDLPEWQPVGIPAGDPDR